MNAPLKRLLLLSLMVTLASTAMGEEATRKGRLCFLAGKEAVELSRCAEVQGARIDTEPADQERRFVWLSADGKQLITGPLAASSAVIDLDSIQGTIRLELEGNTARGWPAATEIGLGDRLEYRLNLSANAASQLRELRIPAGPVALRMLAEHHKPQMFTRMLGKEPVDLGTVLLEPRPRFAAVVNNNDASVLAGATLVDDFGELLAKADHLGRLTFEAQCKRECVLPNRVSIDYPGLAATRILITDPKRDFDAGTVTLGAGGALDLTVRRPEGQSFPITVRLSEAAEQGPRRKSRVIAEKTMAADADRLTIEKLPAGKSELYLNGPEKGQVLSTYVTIESGKTVAEEIRIDPTEVNVRVTKAGAAVKGAAVTVGVPHGTPNYDVELAPTDEDGRASTIIWQDGAMVASAAKEKVRELVFFQTGTTGRQDVEIRISPTVLRGRVYDGDTDQPLSNKAVSYKWTGGQSNHFGSVQTDESGRYEIQGARAGVHTLHLQHPDYLPAEATIETTGGEHERTLDLVLTKGQEHKVTLRWSDGRPIAGADIMQVIESGKRYRRWKSGPAGELTVHLAKNTSIDVWIVPVEASFAMATISAASTSSNVTVPVPAGSLTVTAVDGSGQPLPSSHLALRFQGRTLDYSVLEAMTARQGNRFRTGSNGTTTLRGLPAGQYEFWATQYDGDDFLMGEPRERPVTSFYYSGGEQSVRVEANRFQPRR